MTAFAGHAAHKCIFVHGFVTDEHGRKMSMSLGNLVYPTDVTLGGQGGPKRAAYGTGCLRLWVYGHATNNIHITVGAVGESVPSSTAERLQKTRNTCRFLLGVLSRYDLARPLPEIEWLHRYILHRLSECTQQCAEAHDRYQSNQPAPRADPE